MPEAGEPTTAGNVHEPEYKKKIYKIYGTLDSVREEGDLTAVVLMKWNSLSRTRDNGEKIQR